MTSSDESDRDETFEGRLRMIKEVLMRLDQCINVIIGLFPLLWQRTNRKQHNFRNAML